MSKMNSPDHSWSAVNRTAHAVAVLRWLESRLHGAESLIRDRCIPELLAGGDFDHTSFDGMEIPAAVGTDPEAVLRWLDADPEHPAARRLMININRLALRTAKIDALLEAFVAQADQLVIIGAGLDTRAFNLEGAAALSVFEVDFPQVLAFKRERLGHLPLTCRARVEIAGDATAADFSDRLLAGGFEPEKPALWLMEGLLVYLSAAQIVDLNRQVRMLSAPGSRLIATFLGADAPLTFSRGMISRFDDAPAMLAQYGWRAQQVHYAEIAREFGRSYPDNYDVYLAYTEPLG
jgi:methyltransferase (TIGR00027 family)